MSELSSRQSVKDTGVGEPLRAFRVSASDLEAELSPEERTVVSVVRLTGPSVGFVTSVWPWTRNGTPNNSRNNTTSSTETSKKSTNLPRGQGLGSGSCFVVESTRNKIYLVTNFHVVEQAYDLQQQAHEEERIRSIMMTTTGSSSSESKTLTHKPCTSVLSRLVPPPARPVPEVYVRINSATVYTPAQIVNVDPAYDVALLAMDSTPPNSTIPQVLPALSFGSSSDLLVGQGLIAIGNPFGLENSVSTGVVSALDRQVITGRPRPSSWMSPPTTIRNCIQTDAAINPGNSGGPLLNRKGEVVGVNTAILTTSGSNAGIGFAVPSDAVRTIIQDWIRRDQRQNKPKLGVAIIKLLSSSTAAAGMLSAMEKQLNGSSSVLQRYQTWISRVEPSSPASEAGLQAVQIDPKTCCLKSGEAIVAWNGKPLEGWRDLCKEIDRCVGGEQINLTLENIHQERRVVYLTMNSTATKIRSK